MDTYIPQAGIIWGTISAELQKPLGALVLLVLLDYITGVCVAVKERTLSSKIGSKGLSTKVTMFAMVGLSVVVDQLLIGAGLALSTVTILFYCSNELISICENASKMGLPLPKKLVVYLKSLQDGAEKGDKESKPHE